MIHEEIIRMALCTRESVIHAFHRVIAKTAVKRVSGSDTYKADEPFQSTGT